MISKKEFSTLLDNVKKDIDRPIYDIEMINIGVVDIDTIKKENLMFAIFATHFNEFLKEGHQLMLKQLLHPPKDEPNDFDAYKWNLQPPITLSETMKQKLKGYDYDYKIPTKVDGAQSGVVMGTSITEDDLIAYGSSTEAIQKFKARVTKEEMVSNSSMPPETSFVKAAEKVAEKPIKITLMPDRFNALIQNNVIYRVAGTDYLIDNNTVFRIDSDTYSVTKTVIDPEVLKSTQA